MELTPNDVQNALKKLDLDIEIRFFEDSTATSQLAADNIGCELGQIAKSLAFMIDGSPILIIASGDQRIDEKKLAAMFGVSRKRVKTATADECITIFGYAPGGVPPVGLRTSDLSIYLDDSLQRYDMLYAAGGAHNAIFPITLNQLVQATGGTFADVKREA